MPVVNPSVKNRQSLWTCLILGILVLLVFSPMTRFEFISYDDPDFVTNNPYIQEGLSWAAVKWAFTSLFNYWQPLVWLSYMLDYQLFGLSAAGFHFTNLVLHLGNTLLLFLALKRLTKAHWPSAIVAALFAFHPLHVETVAWISDRKSLLSSTFWMLSLLAYAWYAEKPSGKRYGLTLISFALGLMCKSMLVTLPCVLLLLDWWPLKRIPFFKAPQDGTRNEPAPADSCKKYVLLEKIPFFLLSAASSILTMSVKATEYAITVP